MSLREEVALAILSKMAQQPVSLAEFQKGDETDQATALSWADAAIAIVERDAFERAAKEVEWRGLHSDYPSDEETLKRAASAIRALAATGDEDGSA